MRDLVPYVQFKKHEKHPRHGDSTQNFTKSNTPPGCFLRFLSCTNGTKSHKASHILINFFSR